MIKSLGWAFLGIFLIINSKSILLAQHADSELVEFEQITIAEGLSQNTVTAILQDTKGFLWLGTLDGLNRFDGINFKHFTHKKKDSTSIANSSIHTLYKDYEGTLWVGTEEGLSMYDNSTETFINYATEIPNKVYSIFEFENNRSGLWLGTSGGLYYFDLKKKELEYIPLPFENKESEKIEIAHNEFFDTNSKSINAVEGFTEDILLLGTGSQGLVLYDKSSREIKQIFQKDSGKKGILSNYIFDVQKHPDGSFLIATGNGVSRYQPENHTFNNYPIDDITLSIFIDSKNKIWCGTEENGLLVLDKNMELAGHFLKDQGNPKSLGDNGVYNIFESADGNVWVGTYNNGVNKYDPSKRKFPQFNLSGDPLMELSNNSLRKILEDEKGNVWVATVNTGLNKIDFDRKKVEQFFHSEDKGNTLSSNRLNVLAQDKTGNIWVGFANDGINILSGKNETNYNIQIFEPTGDNLPSQEIMDIKVDVSGNIWVGTYGGLAKIKAGTWETKSYIPNSQIKESPENKIRTIDVSDPSNIWLGTQGGGLLKFDIHSEEFEFFKSEKDNEHSLSSNFVNSVHLDKDEILWVGTKKGGLNRFDPVQQVFESFTEEDGLSNNYIYGILEDDHQNLWISTNKGISKFDKNTNQFQNFHTKDGLQSEEFNVGSYFKNKEGVMYFGGVNGFNYFHPDEIKLNQITPKVLFTEFRIQNKIVEIQPDGILQKSITETSEIVLNHRENMISVSFAGIQYSSPEKNQFQYKLEGFNENWVNIANQRSVTFTNLNPGNYTLKVKTANSDGVWNEGTANLDLIILPAWYESWLFRILLVLFIFGSITGIYLFRLNMIARQKKALEEEVFLRTMEIQEKSNEINTQNEELKAQQEELETHQELMMKNNEELLGTIEQLKNAQAKLIQAEKMASLGTLTAGIAHELNNPLNYVSSGIVGLKKALNKFLILLKEYDKLDETNFHKKIKKIGFLKGDMSYSPMMELISKVTKGIEIGAQRSTEIVKSLRTFSRMDNEISQNIDIHMGIESTILLLHHSCKNRVVIKKNFGKIPGISCFPGKLNQVFMNVLSNAIDAIEGEGQIEIATKLLERDDKKYVQICFIDSGKGIDMEMKHKIFEPFFTTKEVGKGTGLGLAISQTIIEEHHGKIEIESPNGKGTHVSLFIPIRPE